MDVRATSDDILPKLARAMQADMASCSSGSGGHTVPTVIVAAASPMDRRNHPEIPNRPSIADDGVKVEAWDDRADERGKAPDMDMAMQVEAVVQSEDQNASCHDGTVAGSLPACGSSEQVPLLGSRAIPEGLGRPPEGLGRPPEGLVRPPEVEGGSAHRRVRLKRWYVGSDDEADIGSLSDEEGRERGGGEASCRVGGGGNGGDISEQEDYLDDEEEEQEEEEEESDGEGFLSSGRGKGRGRARKAPSRGRGRGAAVKRSGRGSATAINRQPSQKTYLGPAVSQSALNTTASVPNLMRDSPGLLGLASAQWLQTSTTGPAGPAGLVDGRSYVVPSAGSQMLQNLGTLPNVGHQMLNQNQINTAAQLLALLNALKQTAPPKGGGTGSVE